MITNAELRRLVSMGDATAGEHLDDRAAMRRLLIALLAADIFGMLPDGDAKLELQSMLTRMGQWRAEP